MEIKEGNINVSDEYGCKKATYPIEQITAELGMDRSNMIGALRYTYLTIESSAPSDINAEAETMLFNMLAQEEFFDEEQSYKEQARETIRNSTGVVISKIEIE